MTDNPKAFPAWTWVPLGGLLLALGFLPTLAAPFDFIDDGNLVYPAPAELSFSGHVSLWWEKVQANVEHLGPFRPVLWLHWEVAANLFDGDPFLWRTMRLVWCALAAAALLGLLRELKIPPTAALLAGAAAMWNPYRSEIWTSLTLAEGVAMPYALGALLSARRAATSSRPAVWDALAILGLLAALGCKNIFVALLPAMLALRLWPDGVTLAEGWRQNRLRASLYLLPLIMPLVHFVYFQLNWHAGQYQTPGPTWAQAGRIASWLKGAAGLDFIGVGLFITLALLGWHYSGERLRTFRHELWNSHRAALLAGSLLLASGIAVYLPVAMMAARYTMPAIWGLDILLAVIFTCVLALKVEPARRVALGTVFAGLALMMVANIGRQEKVAARANFLWDTLHHLEATAPTNARIAWVGGETSDGYLNIEEGIHFAWHLRHRGRPDLQIGLFNDQGQPVPRVELPPLDGPPHYRLASLPVEWPGRWNDGPAFTRAYRFGRKSFTCRLVEQAPETSPTLIFDPSTLAFMKEAFEKPISDDELLERLAGKPTSTGERATAELNPKK